MIHLMSNDNNNIITSSLLTFPPHNNNNTQHSPPLLTKTTSNMNISTSSSSSSSSCSFDNTQKRSPSSIGLSSCSLCLSANNSIIDITTGNKFNTDCYKCGYPKKTRSLVADAKFDTQRNRELARERSWLLESLQKSSSQDNNGSLDQSSLEQLNLEQVAGKDVFDAVAPLLANASFQDFPKHISQLDQCNHLLIKYEPELDPTHPGFHDLEYRQRRKEVAQIAFNYKHDEKIPDVEYNYKEIKTWRFIYLRLKEAYAKYACEQHNKAIEQLERECGYSPDSIPQLQRVSEFLQRKTGWRLRPAAGLLSARDFLASLAYRVFQTTQYIRHWGNPEHSVEPDCIHELMGHIPMLCDQSFAQFSQEIGIASLGASDEQIEKFATLYWFTVEFGLCRENNQLKCYGAGLLSSYGEMEHALESNKPALKDFVPEETACEAYDDAEYQVTYYVAQSFDDAKLKIKQYAEKHLNRDHELAYDPYTCSIKVLDSLDRLDLYANQIKNDVMRLSSSITKIKIKSQQQHHSHHNSHKRLNRPLNANISSLELQN